MKKVLLFLQTRPCFKELTCATFIVGCLGHTAPAQYCTPSPNNCVNEGVTNVTFGTLNNSSAFCINSGYSNYTSLPAPNIVQGIATPVSIGINVNVSGGAAIWIDYNHSNSFTADECTLLGPISGSGLATVTGSITIPATALTGITRMRVRETYSTPGYAGSHAIAAGSACLVNDYTEFEDYNINIVGPCSGIPNPGTVAAVAGAVVCGTTASLTLTGSTSGTGITYQWQYSITPGVWVNFGVSTIQVTPVVVQSTQYRCIVTCAGSGNATSSPVTINVTMPPPVVNIGNDTTICPGVTYNLSAGNSGSSYAWNTGATTQSIDVSTPGTYSVLVTLPNGCANSDAINIVAGTVPVNNLPATRDLCAGSTLDLNAGNTGSTFLWTPGGNTTQINTVNTPGIYTARVISVHGCTINSTTSVTGRPLPVPNLGNDTVICQGVQLTLDAGNPGSTYLWSSNGVSQTITVADSGTYTVVVTTPYNCTGSDSKHIGYLPAPRVEGFNFIPFFYEDLGKVQFTALDPTHATSYYWDFGDGTTSTQTSPTHTYAAAGSYNVTLKVANVCTDFSISQVINVNLATGMVTLGKEAINIALYPNPSREYLTIDNESSNVNMETVRVLNMLGAAVYYEKADNRSRHRLSVARLPAGVYTLQLLTNRGSVNRKFEVIK